MIGQSRTALGLLFTLPAVILSGCNRPHGVSIDQCSNPKLLRAKVSDTVFDFPNSVGFLHGSLYSKEDELEKIGIVDIRYPDMEKIQNTDQIVTISPCPLGTSKPMFDLSSKAMGLSRKNIAWVMK